MYKVLVPLHPSWYPHASPFFDVDDQWDLTAVLVIYTGCPREKGTGRENNKANAVPNKSAAI